MFKQIFPTSTIRNIWGTGRRICMLILGLKGLKCDTVYVAVTSLIEKFFLPV